MKNVDLEMNILKVMDVVDGNEEMCKKLINAVSNAQLYVCMNKQMSKRDKEYILFVMKSFTHYLNGDKNGISFDNLNKLSKCVVSRGDIIPKTINKMFDAFLKYNKL